MTLAVLARMLLFAAAELHRHRLAVVLGDSFMETVLLLARTFGTLLKSVLTFLACLL